LARVRDEDPRAPENALHFECEHVRIGVHAAVDPVGLDEIFDSFR
jgi:hypothetical protein